MKVAVIGSRNASDDIVYTILQNIPAQTTEVVSGGAKGIDSAAEIVAESLGLPVKIFLPDYISFGKSAPLNRNDEIVDYADMILAFWDGKSKGTQNVIKSCILKNKAFKIIRMS